MQTFGSIPHNVIQDSGNSFMAGKFTGLHIAAIKCLLIFGLKNNFRTREVSLSLKQLKDLTGLSKPMIVRGINKLIELEIILKVKQDRTNIVNKYRLIFTERRFTKIPYIQLLDQLPCFPNKGVYVLAALKIYLVLLQVRDNHSKQVKISYSRLCDYGINRKHISKALEILITNDLISVSREMDEDGCFVKTSNHYLVKGLLLQNTQAN